MTTGIGATKYTGFTQREKLLSQMRNGESLQWDLIIVGGGITGAGVLREATRQGYKALLVEQKDFAWGTSSRSSKMIHGGLRYLATGDMKLTRHSVTERERLLQEAPGLVNRMGYYFVLRKGQFPGRLVFTMLLKLYDFFAGIKDHRYFSNEGLKTEFNGIDATHLNGACYYTDAVTDDARLVLRVLQESIAAGAATLNYTKVKHLIINHKKVCGVAIEDAGTKESFELTAPVVINATGAWADKLRSELNSEKRVRPLRGSHLVLPQQRLEVKQALALFHPVDKRGVFIFPWEGTTVVGTTDVDHAINIDIEASITQQEVDYLFQVVQASFPDNKVGEQDIISTWAGVRSVIGSEQSKDPSKERRDHAVWSDNGLITVSGGKLTTFRLIALDALNAAKALLAAPKNIDNDRIFEKLTLSPKQLACGNTAFAKRLLGRYGDTAQTVLSISKDEFTPIANTNFSLAECRWALRYEAVHHLDDLMLRRTRLGLVLAKGGEEVFGVLEQLFIDEKNWDSSRWQQELGRYKDIWHKHYSLPHESNT